MVRGKEQKTTIVKSFVEITPKAKQELSACEKHQEKEAFALSLTEEEAAAFFAVVE